jgi:hypothetical protein
MPVDAPRHLLLRCSSTETSFPSSGTVLPMDEHTGDQTAPYLAFQASVLSFNLMKQIGRSMSRCSRERATKAVRSQTDEQLDDSTLTRLGSVAVIF